MFLGNKGVADVTPKEWRKAMGLGNVPVECGKYGQHQMVVLGDTSGHLARGPTSGSLAYLNSVSASDSRQGRNSTLSVSIFI